MTRHVMTAIATAAISLALAGGPVGAQGTTTLKQTPKVTDGNRLDIDRKCLRFGKLVGGMCIYPKTQNACTNWGAECTEVYGEDTCRCPQLP